MIIKPSLSVIKADRVEPEIELHLSAAFRQEAPQFPDIGNAIAYSSLINSHDHLIGNWFPRAGDHRPYLNSHIWVEDMKVSFSVQERNIYWVNDGSFQLLTPNAYNLARLGCYKQIFSGCGIVQDHGPNQNHEYYRQLPLTVVENYTQCHSLTLGNWWGGGTAEDEMQRSQGKAPFIIHLGEGLDDDTRAEFEQLKQRNLLKANTMIIHGISLTPAELAEMAKVGATICWCPGSNYYLIGQTMDVMAALAAGTNVVLGSDSTLTGGINLLDEFANAHQHFPQIPLPTIYRMMTENAAKALFLPAKYGWLNPDKTENLLLTDALDSDPFLSLLELDASRIKLLMQDGQPLFGDSEWLDWFRVNPDDFVTFRTGNREKFVLGDPLEICDRIDDTLGYHKDFPYLPF